MAAIAQRQMKCTIRDDIVSLKNLALSLSSSTRRYSATAFPVASCTVLIASNAANTRAETAAVVEQQLESAFGKRPQLPLLCSTAFFRSENTPLWSPRRKDGLSVSQNRRLRLLSRLQSLLFQRLAQNDMRSFSQLSFISESPKQLASQIWT